MKSKWLIWSYCNVIIILRHVENVRCSSTLTSVCEMWDGEELWTESMLLSSWESDNDSSCLSSTDELLGSLSFILLYDTRTIINYKETVKNCTSKQASSYIAVIFSIAEMMKRRNSDNKNACIPFSISRLLLQQLCDTFFQVTMVENPSFAVEILTLSVTVQEINISGFGNHIAISSC